MLISVTLLLLFLSCKSRFEEQSSRSASWWPFQSYFEGCTANPNKLPFLIAEDAYTKETMSRYWGRIEQSEFTSESGGKYAISLFASFTEPGYPPLFESGLKSLEADDRWLEHNGDDSVQDRSFAARMMCTSGAVELINDQVSELLDFVFGIYAKRKKFDDSMVEELKAESMNVLRTSIYAVIREEHSQKIVSVIRIARAPYGRRYVLKAGDPLNSVPLEDDSGNFGPVFRAQLPELWSGHVGQHGSPHEGKDDFPEFDPSRAQYSRGYTVPWDPKTPKTYLTHSHLEQGFQERVLERTAFVSLPLEQALKIKLPREAPGRRAASESDAESAARRSADGADAGDVDVYYSAGELMEIGSYAIEKGHSEAVRLRFYLEIARLIDRISGSRHVRLWNRSNSPRLYTALGFRELGDKVTDEFGTWTLQMAEPAQLLASIGEIVTKLAKEELSEEEQLLLLQEVDGWDRKWGPQLVR